MSQDCDNYECHGNVACVIRTPGELGAALRARRRAQGMTQLQVAEAAGVSRAFVSDLERGDRSGAELARVLAVIRALDLAVDLVAQEPRSFEAVLERLIGEPQ